MTKTVSIRELCAMEGSHYIEVVSQWQWKLNIPRAIYIKVLHLRPHNLRKTREALNGPKSFANSIVYIAVMLSLQNPMVH